MVTLALQVRRRRCTCWRSPCSTTSNSSSSSSTARSLQRRSRSAKSSATTTTTITITLATRTATSWTTRRRHQPVRQRRPLEMTSGSPSATYASWRTAARASTRNGRSSGAALASGGVWWWRCSGVVVFSSTHGSLMVRVRSHIRVHTGEKPFPCTYPDCDKSFAEKSAMTRYADSGGRGCDGCKLTSIVAFTQTPADALARQAVQVHVLGLLQELQRKRLFRCVRQATAAFDAHLRATDTCAIRCAGCRARACCCCRVPPQDPRGGQPVRVRAPDVLQDVLQPEEPEEAHPVMAQPGREEHIHVRPCALFIECSAYANFQIPSVCTVWRCARSWSELIEVVGVGCG